MCSIVVGGGAGRSTLRHLAIVRTPRCVVLVGSVRVCVRLAFGFQRTQRSNIFTYHISIIVRVKIQLFLIGYEKCIWIEYAMDRIFMF